MTQPFLYIRHKSSVHAQCAVFQEIDGQVVQVGTDFGTSEDSAILTIEQNRVIHWENDLYAINRDTIFKYDVANSGDWGVWYTFASPRVTELTKGFKMGFTVASIEGSGVLVCAYSPVTEPGIRFVLIDKDLNVTEDEYFDNDLPNLNDARTHLAKGAVSWRNSIVFRSTTATVQTRNWDYNLKEKTLTQNGTTGYNPANPLLVIGDNIYSMGYGEFDDTCRFLKKFGLSYLNQAQIGTQERGTTGSNGGMVGTACEIDGKIFLFQPGGNQGDGPGWQCHEITLDSNGDFLSQANVTSVVLPTSLSSSNGSETSMMIRIDGVTNSGVDPIYEFINRNNQSQGTSCNLYRWNNAPSGILELIDATMNNRAFSDVATSNGTGGGFIWSGSGTLNAAQPCLSYVAPLGNQPPYNIKCKTTIYGVNQSGVVLELLYDKNGENTITRGTILSTTHGTLINNSASGLVADNTTEVTLVWDAISDGIVGGDNPKVSVRVFIP